VKRRKGGDLKRAWVPACTLSLPPFKVKRKEQGFALCSHEEEA